MVVRTQKQQYRKQQQNEGDKVMRQLFFVLRAEKLIE